MADTKMLKNEVKVWEEKRNRAKCQIQWKLTVEDARNKLKRHFPSILE
jgi:hypothetical protein